MSADARCHTVLVHPLQLKACLVAAGSTHHVASSVQGWDGKQWFSQGHPAKSHIDRLPPQTRQRPLPDPIHFSPISHNDLASRSLAAEVAGQLRKRSAKAAAAEPTPNMSRIAQPLLTCFYSLNNAFLEGEPLLRVRHEAARYCQRLADLQLQ